MKETKKQVGLLDLLTIVWRKKVLVLLISFLVAGLAYGVTQYVIEPTYKSTTRVYIVSDEQSQTTVTLQNVQASSYLLSDFKELVKSESVLSQVISQDNLNLSVEELSEKVTVTIPSDTRVATISVTDHSATLAARIANDIRTIVVTQLQEYLTQVKFMVIDEATVQSKPDSPSLIKNLVFAFAGSFLLMSLLVIWLELNNDRIRSREDIENLGLTLLGYAPEWEKKDAKLRK